MIRHKHKNSFSTQAKKLAHLRKLAKYAHMADKLGRLEAQQQHLEYPLNMDFITQALLLPQIQ